MKQVCRILLSVFFVAVCLFLFPYKHQGQIIMSESFEGTFPPAGWTLFNAGTGNSWSQNTDAPDAYSGAKSLQYFYHFTSAANAWIFSPGVNLTAGTTYRISYFYRNVGITNDERMKVTIGQGATVANQTTILHDYPVISNGSYLEGVDYFVASISGSHNLAFNCYSPANQYILLIDSVVIKPAGMPSISSFFPKYGGAGETITLTGTNFTGVNAVSFGGIAAASFTVNSPASITATLAGGASGNVSVTNSFTTGSLAGFTYLSGLTFSPSSGPVGTAVTIRGTGFDAVPANNTVFFGAQKAIVTGGTTTSLNVIVPAGASYEPLTVNTGGVIKYSLLPFIVTIPHGGGGFLPTSFVSVLDTATGNNPKSLCARDFDGDGKIDIAVTNSNDNTISIFRNTSIDTSISFASRINFATGTMPVNIATADFDGDNKPDIVVTNFNAASVSVFRNTSTPGAISFASKVDFTTGGSPVSVATGDFDLDGKPDMAVVNYDNSNTVSVFRNTGSGTNISFTPKADYVTEVKPACVAIGDLDGDGAPDMVVSTEYTYYSPFQHSRVSVFKNNSSPGSLAFATRIDYLTQDPGKRVNLVDFNIDGKLDIAVQTPGAGNSVLRNTCTVGTISFAVKQDLGWVATNVGLCDLDGDGKPDIVQETNNMNQVGILRNTSSGNTFSVAQRAEYVTASSSGPAFNNTLNTCIADLDGDGKADVITTNSQNSISVLRNKINEPVIISFNPPGANLGDTVTIKGLKLMTTQSVSFGGVAATYFSALSDTIVKAVVGNGATGAIKLSTLYGSATVSRFVFPGIPVISSLSHLTDTVGGFVTIYGNNFDPVAANNTVYFGSVKANIVTANPTSIMVNVPPGINYRPISITTNNVSAYSPKPFTVKFNNGGTALTVNSFSPKTDVSLGTGGSSNPSGLMTCDIDLDGKPDVFTASYTVSNGGKVLKNFSSPDNLLFGTANNLVTGGYSRNVITGDLDGDGKQDLIFGSSNSWALAIFMNNSTGGNLTFAPKKDIGTTGNPNDLAVGDLDGDGKPELVVSSNVDNTFSVFRNTGIVTGAVSFENPIAYPTGASSSPSGISISDVDGDGKTDVIVANQLLNNISVFRNTSTNGIISFAPKTDYTAGSAPIDVAVSDMDGDGKTDIIVANQNAGISVLRNLSVSGTVSFAPKTDFAIAGATLYGLSANDVDGDGKPDIAVVAGNTAKAYVFRNTGNPGSISLDTYIDYQLGNQPRSILLADIDIDGKPDILSPNYTGGNLSILRNQTGEPIRIILCPPLSSANLTSNISGSAYQWQVNTGGGFVDISDNANYSGTSTANLQLINIPSSWYGYIYRCVVNSVNSAAFTLIFQDTWTGAVSNAWENPANWSCGAVPDSNTDVIINSGTIQLNTNTAIRSLKVKPGVSFTVVSGVTLTVLH